MAEPMNPGTWETLFIEATAEQLRRGKTVDELEQLVRDVADAELVFSDGKEPA